MKIVRPLTQAIETPLGYIGYVKNGHCDDMSFINTMCSAVDFRFLHSIFSGNYSKYSFITWAFVNHSPTFQAIHPFSEF